MANPDNYGRHAAATTEVDARSRAWRTFLQGLAVDVLLAVCLVVYDALNSDSVDWRLLALTLGKTALMTAASYVMRKLSPPPA